MKLFFILLFLITSSLNGYCQDWKSTETNDIFSISVAEIEHNKPSDGINHQRLIFKYENHTDKTISLSFKREVKYSDQTITQEQDFEITIPANSSLQYDKSADYNRLYYLFKKDNDDIIKQSLSDFKIINLRIN